MPVEELQTQGLPTYRVKLHSLDAREGHQFDDELFIDTRQQVGMPHVHLPEPIRPAFAIKPPKGLLTT